MKLNKFSILFAAICGLFMAAAAFPQGSTFSDLNVDYTFDLPEAAWKMVAKPSATNPNVEYVYGDRRDGHLEVRKISVTKTDVLSELIRTEENRLQFLPGYVAGKEEQFAGHLKGMAFNFEFVRAGLNMSGRYYFLRANDTTVYVLRFSGLQNKLKSIRNQTDSIARTFEIKKVN